MSANQTELRAFRYRRLLEWFGQQQELAPINAVHYAILWQIYNGSPDVQRLCVMGDAVVALYNQPLDVVNLTMDDGLSGGNSQADDSWIAE